MSLSSLRIERIRCIESAELELDGRWNFAFGPNGAGKTSLLEAAHILGRGRSFRVRHNARLVRHGTAGFEIAGIVAERLGEGRARDRRLGVRFENARLELRIDGKAGCRASELAGHLPVHVLEPGMHALIAAGPGQRRRFLDWGVFHVEPYYLPAWRDYRRALGQRNAALKGRASGAELDAWSQQLAMAAERVDRARAEYVGRWLPRAVELSRRLSGLTVTITFDPGGYAETGFAAALEAGVGRDRRAGVTVVGPHRADLRLLVDAAPVREAASRGQQKLIAAGLILGQVAEHVSARPGAGLLLVDDPAAELDRVSLGRLMAELQGLPTQMLVTGIEPAALEPLGPGRVFHVEHGVIRAQSV